MATELRAASLRRGVDSRVGSDIGVYSFGYGFGGSARGRAGGIGSHGVVARRETSLQNITIEQCSIGILHPSPQK